MLCTLTAKARVCKNKIINALKFREISNTVKQNVHIETDKIQKELSILGTNSNLTFYSEGDSC